MEAFLESMQEEFDYYDDQLTRLASFYKEVPLYQEVFESEDKEIQKTNETNNEIEAKSLTVVQRLVATIKKILNKAKEIINNIFNWFKATKDEQSAFRQFQKECKNNPEFANKKVTMKEWRKINDIREKHLSSMEADYKNLKDEEAETRESLLTDAQEVIKKMGKEIADVTTSEGAAITMVGALNYAKQSQQHAAKVQMMIDWDFGLMNALEKKLTSREIRRFKRKLKGIQIRLKILNLIGRGRCEQAKSLRECIADVTKKGSDMMKAQRIAMHNKATRGAAKDIAGVAGGTVKDVGVGYAEKKARLKYLQHENKKIEKARAKEASKKDT